MKATLVRLYPGVHDRNALLSIKSFFREETIVASDFFLLAMKRHALAQAAMSLFILIHEFLRNVLSEAFPLECDNPCTMSKMLRRRVTGTNGRILSWEQSQYRLPLVLGKKNFRKTLN